MPDEVPFARGVWGMPPRKFLNLEALKCHYWCSNTTISVKNLGYFLQIFQFFGTSELNIQHVVFFYENWMKISEHESKSGLFLS